MEIWKVRGRLGKRIDPGKPGKNVEIPEDLAQAVKHFKHEQECWRLPCRQVLVHGGASVTGFRSAVASRNRQLANYEEVYIVSRKGICGECLL